MISAAFLPHSHGGASPPPLQYDHTEDLLTTTSDWDSLLIVLKPRVTMKKTVFFKSGKPFKN